MRAVVYGLAVTGASTVRALQRRGFEVIAADDRVDASKRDLADALGVDLLPIGGTGASAAQTTGGPGLDAALAGADLLAPAPGVPEDHPVFDTARRGGVEIVSEIELAYRWEQERPGGPRPMLAVTGTDGKTTTTELTVAVLRQAGVATLPLGNTDIPLVDAVDGGDHDDLDVLVVECTSFRLAWTRQFRADAAAWLNFAPDHLNWHRDLASYEAAKARVFEFQRQGDVAIGFVDDPVVRRHLDRAPGRSVTFGRTGADYRLAGSTLLGPRGPIAEVSSMRRGLPHDITNALAVSALVIETGLAAPEHVAAALASFDAPAHRLEALGEWGGVAWYNDSKATTPHAAATAVAAFDSLVLIAGGSRKGVDLSPIAAAPQRIRAVVAIGEAGPDIRAVFAGSVDVVDAGSMAEAIDAAAGLAHPGDAVVLSPGCASFDWYSGFEARGDHFRTLVRHRFSSTEAAT